MVYEIKNVYVYLYYNIRECLQNPTKQFTHYEVLNIAIFRAQLRNYLENCIPGKTCYDHVSFI